MADGAEEGGLWALYSLILLCMLVSIAHLLLDVTLPVLGCPGEPLTHRGFVVVVYVLVLLVVEGRGSIGCVLGV